jgi:hypothetical protein
MTQEPRRLPFGSHRGGVDLAENELLGADAYPVPVVKRLRANEHVIVDTRSVATPQILNRRPVAVDENPSVVPGNQRVDYRDPAFRPTPDHGLALREIELLKQKPEPVSSQGLSATSRQTSG